MHRTVIGILWLVTMQLQASGGVSRRASCEELLENQWLRAVVIQNINQLAQFPDHWAIASQQIMLNVIVYFQNPNLDFAYFERFFRQNHVPLFLVASSQPLQGGLEVGYPADLAKLKGDAVPKYHLWVGVRGAEEAGDLKKRLGISDEENLLRLRETGFIFVTNRESLADNPSVSFADDETIESLKNTQVQRPFDPEMN